jgi:hypothetical protein
VESAGETEHLEMGGELNIKTDLRDDIESCVSVRGQVGGLL